MAVAGMFQSPDEDEQTPDGQEKKTARYFMENVSVP